QPGLPPLAGPGQAPEEQAPQPAALLPAQERDHGVGVHAGLPLRLGHRLTSELRSVRRWSWPSTVPQANRPPGRRADTERTAAPAGWVPRRGRGLVELRGRAAPGGWNRPAGKRAVCKYDPLRPLHPPAAPAPRRPPAGMKRILSLAHRGFSLPW